MFHINRAAPAQSGAATNHSQRGAISARAERSTLSRSTGLPAGSPLPGGRMQAAPSISAPNTRQERSESRKSKSTTGCGGGLARLLRRAFGRSKTDSPIRQLSTAKGTQPQEIAFDYDKLASGQTLGFGSFGAVVRATMVDKKGAVSGDKTKAVSKYYAVKCDRVSTREAVAKEARNLQMAGEFGFAPENSPQTIVMLDKGTSLAKIQGLEPVSFTGDTPKFAPLPQTFKQLITRQLAEAIGALHAKDILHGDIKAENILVDKSGIVSLIDFAGASKSSGTDETGDRTYDINTFSPLTSAPEIYRENRPTTQKADAWSLGMVLLQMETGELPPIARPVDGLTQFDMREYIKVMQTIKGSLTISAECKKVLVDCLSLTDEQRPTMTDLLSKYDYFKQPPLEQMTAMELTVAHKAAFNRLIQAETNLERLQNIATSSQERLRYQKVLEESQAEVKALQAALDRKA